MESKKVIILTGGSGFVGKHLLPALIDSGYKVVALKRPETIVEYEHPNVIWLLFQDLLEYIESSEELFAIVHLATEYGRTAEKILKVEQVNVSLPLELLLRASRKGLRLFLNTDSFFSKPCFEKGYMWPYVLSKRCFIEYGKECVSASQNLIFINMRLEHVYGPGDGGEKFVPFLIEQIRANKTPVKCTEGKQRRDFVYVKDVVSAYLIALNAQYVNQYIEFQVGRGVSFPLNVFINQLAKELGTSNGAIDYGAIPMRAGEIMDSFAENESLLELGWRPMFTIESGVSEMLRQGVWR